MTLIMDMKNTQLLAPEFYTRDDVALIARDLLGKIILTHIEGAYTGGIITETEAYAGTNDRACHANDGKRTARTEVMYARGGVAYVYLCYGLHSMLNVVTNEEGKADAVLIRAIKPLWGLASIRQRRVSQKKENLLCSGPGALAQALGIDKKMNGLPFTGPDILIAEKWCAEGESYLAETPEKVITGRRIGVAYAGEDALRPWRFIAG